MHYPHIEFTFKCSDKIAPIYQRVGRDSPVTGAALDLERDGLFRVRHLTILSPLQWVTHSGSFAVESHTGVVISYKRDLPHSRQHVLNRDVIKPQDGHILCDLIPAICGFSLRIP
jgi:hypothetical protein